MKSTVPSCGAVILLQEVVLIFESGVTIEMKPIEQHLPMVLFIVLYKVVVTILSLDKILKCDHSSES